MNSREAAKQITNALALLKNYNIKQKDISEKLNYTSLSKAKNFESYPQKIIENKSRQELLLEIISNYSLTFDEYEQISTKHPEYQPIQEISNDLIYYVQYYYSSTKDTVKKALVEISNRRTARLEFLDKDVSLSVWEGSFEVIESYTFLNLTKKGDVTPVKILCSFFSGTVKYKSPILLGTFCGIKRDGNPTAGVAVMELVESKDAAIKKINQETDKKLLTYLKGKSFTVPRHTPVNLDDIQ